MSTGGPWENPYAYPGENTFGEYQRRAEKERLKKEKEKKLREQQAHRQRMMNHTPIPAPSRDDPFGIHYDQEQMNILHEASEQMRTRMLDDAANAVANGGSAATHVGDASITNVAAHNSAMSYRDLERMHEQMRSPYETHAPRVKDLNNILHDIENNNRDVHTKFLQEAHLRGITNYELILAIVFERYFREPSALDTINDELMQINKRKRDNE